MMIREKYKKIFNIFFLLIIFIILIWFFRLDRFGFSNVKWGDYLVLNGSNYTGQYFNNDERILVEESLIRDKIGEIKFKMQGKVNNSYYNERYGCNYT